ncbi:MAG: helix-turn-helix transcriptional regulator [Pseudomonadales bacterium]|nr:helix-turn-helix transcriptional regulator [Pseudomonadales bacterium]
MALLDLLGRTWSIGVIWHLSQGPATFMQLQQRCEQISPSLLNTRLQELKILQLIETQSDGYALTDQGRSLFEIIAPLGQWSKDWAKHLPAGSEG